MPCERKPDLDHTCCRCGTPIVRKRFPSGLLETYGRYATRQTCGRGKCPVIHSRGHMARAHKSPANRDGMGA